MVLERRIVPLWSRHWRPWLVWVSLVGLPSAMCRGDDAPAPWCAVHVRLAEAATAEDLPGIIQVKTADGRLVEIAELLNRGQGLEEPGPVHDWWVLPGPRVVTVPAAPLTIAAISGLETAQVVKSLDLTGKQAATIEIALPRIGHPRRDGFLAGNTHLHLRKLDKAGADRYLREVPRADGLAIVFVSYLERAEADLEYTSNKYAPAELKNLSTIELRFGYGQEHRHNFGSYGEGYGHVLLLDIPGVIQPVSIGPGITNRGMDWPPLRLGIEEARRLGGRAIWAHNRRGLEDTPNFILGRLDANNVCDGNRHGSYEDPYYRYLNVGLRIPLSTGADWFLYDFSRAYVLTPPDSSPTEWLNGLVAGKSYVTNGPLLELRVDGRTLGETIDLARASRVRVQARSSGRTDFRRAELVQNGRVIHTAASRARDDHFFAEMDFSLDVVESCWLALRTPCANAAIDSTEASPGKNEFGAELFAHSSPIYVRLDGQDVFDRDTAAQLIDQMLDDMKQIENRAKFANESQRREVLSPYREACAVLAKQLGRQATSTSSGVAPRPTPAPGEDQPRTDR